MLETLLFPDLVNAWVQSSHMGTQLSALIFSAADPFYSGDGSHNKG